MKYLCFGYYDKGKFEGMTESERNAMFDACLEYDDHLRAGGTGPVAKRCRVGDRPDLVRQERQGGNDRRPYAETKEQLGGILVLEARDMNHAAQLIGQHPSLTFGNIWDIRPAGDMSEIVQASEQRRRQVVAP